MLKYNKELVCQINFNNFKLKTGISLWEEEFKIIKK